MFPLWNDWPGSRLRSSFFRPAQSLARGEWVEVVKEARLEFEFWEDGLDRFLIELQRTCGVAGAMGRVDV
jgi:hypothetical protein